MPYIIAQNLIYLILAVILGAFLAWIFGLCRCNKDDLIAELDGAKAERDALAERLAKLNVDNASEKDFAKIASLEAELADANAKIIALEGKTDLGGAAVGLAAGGALGVALKSNQTAIDTEELEIIKTRNKFLEARVKFFETETKAREAASLTPSKDNFIVSAAGSLSPDELEAAVLAEGDGKKPYAIKRGDDADDLLLIEGVGPKNNEWLNENGIHYFWQIATMTPSELAWLAKHLPNFGSRVYRENWVAQCANLAKGLPPR